MENWSNLSRLITLERETYHRQVQHAQQMIEFAMANNKKEISVLLKEGANPNCFEDMLTPLIACIDNNNYDLAVYLLNAGATISYRPAENDAFWHSLKTKSHDFLELFVNRRCILSLQFETNMTPLIFATNHSDVRSVEILLKHFNIKVNERDGAGNTALHYNVSKQSMTSEDLEIGKMLIAAGADTNATNLEGQKPEDMAADFAAKSMIMAGKLDNELTVNEVKPEEENIIELEKELGISKTPSKRIKI